MATAPTRRITFRADHAPAQAGADRGATVAHVRHVRVRCACGGRATATVTFQVGNVFGWPSVRAAAVDGPVTVMVKTLSGGYVSAERLAAGYPGRTDATAHLSAACPECGEAVKPEAVTGQDTKGQECGDLCMGATGPACDCSCRGENHGVAA